jgi:hypothetical protein
MTIEVLSNTVDMGNILGVVRNELFQPPITLSMPTGGKGNDPALRPKMEYPKAK